MKTTKLSKILSIIIVLCMSIGMIVTTDAADINDPQKYDDSYEFKFIKEFDLMPSCNYDDFNPDRFITRAEYANILCKLGGLKESGGNEFVDIAGNQYEESICIVNTAGLMTGIDKFTFLPDSEIKINEAIKTLLMLMGYNDVALKYGEYPYGYIHVATELGILDGIDTLGDHAATRGDIARLIYNSRTVRIYNQIDFVKTGDDKEETFMTNYMGIDCVKGLVTDNGITGLRTDKDSMIGYMHIGDNKYVVENGFDVRPYIGRYVEAYFIKDDHTGYDVVKYIHEDTRYVNKEIKFDITDFESLSGRTLVYNIGNNKTKKIVLGNTVNIIYNNKASKVLTKSMFDYDYGTVTYVPAMKKNSDTLIIEGYVSWHVVNADKTFETITAATSNKPIGGSNHLDIPVSEIGQSIFIEDQYGLEGDFDDISTNSVVDICKSGNFLLIKVAEPNIERLNVKGKTKVDTKSAIRFDNGETVAVEPYYSTSSEYKDVDVGIAYYVYRNRAGDIVRLVTIANPEMQEGFLVSTYYDDVDEIGYIRILNATGTFEKLKVDKKVIFSDNKNVTINNKQFKSLHNVELNSYVGLINYSVNKSGIVKKIYLPVDIGVDREMGRFGCIYDASKAGYYNAGGQNFGVDLVFASDVGVYRTYSSETDVESRYKYSALNAFTAKYNTPVKAYNYEPHSLYATVMHQTYSTGNSPEIKSNFVIAVVKDMSEEVLYNEESYVSLETYVLSSATPTTFYIEKEDLEKVIATHSGSKDDYVVEKGDIVVIQKSSIDANIIERIALLWDANAPNPIDPDKGRRGSIPDNLGYSTSTQAALSNPYVWYSSSYNSIAAGTDSTSEHRTVFGYAYNVDSHGALLLTSQEVSSKPYDKNYDKSKFFLQPYLPSANNIAIIDYKNNEVTARSGSVTDIKTYLVDGNNASRIIIKTDYGSVKYCMVINGEMK